MNSNTALIAFSGGLDTSFLVPFSREKYGFEKVITCTVNTGGFDDTEIDRIAGRSKEVGADEHITIDAQKEFYEQTIRFLIYGNVSRDGYPLCVGSERLIQGQKALEICQQRGIQCFLHGSTGAGNDQYRLDLVAHVLGRGKIKCIAPIREFSVARETSTEFLKKKAIEVSKRNTDYSYNAGLWGVSIGGKETHASTTLIPEAAWYSQPEANIQDASIKLEFHQGDVCKLESPWGNATEPVEIIKLLAKIGGKYAIGRHYHIGTSIPGKKGRLAYESPAADIIYQAHHNLEKITLTQLQISGKKPLAEEFGRLIHEARFFDPYLTDLCAFLKSTQRRVTGTSEIFLTKGHIKAVTSDSPYNLLGIKGATYGETASAYSGEEAQGACKLHSFEQQLYHTFDS